MAENYYTQTTEILNLVFKELADQEKATSEAERAIVERQKMKAIFGFREAYREAGYELAIRRG